MAMTVKRLVVSNRARCRGEKGPGLSLLMPIDDAIDGYLRFELPRDIRLLLGFPFKSASATFLVWN